MIFDVNSTNKDNSEYTDYALIGTIIFQDNLTEHLLGSKNFGRSIGQCKIEVFSSEGQIPHFHLSDKDINFDCCIKIYSAEYFNHGIHNDKLTRNQCRQLNDYLKTKDDMINVTIWEAIAYTWKISNPECKFPSSKKVKNQPDYTKLEYNIRGQ